MTDNRERKRRQILRILNDCTPLPTVLQEMIFQYLLPAGYTLVYDSSKFQYAERYNSLKDDDRLKRLFVPYNTDEPCVHLPDHPRRQSRRILDTCKIIPYGESVVVYSDDLKCRAYVHLYAPPLRAPGQDQPTCLLKRYGNYSTIHRMYIFDHHLIVQTEYTHLHNSSEGDDTMTFNLIDLKTGAVRWKCRPQTTREVFVPLSDDRLLCLTEDRILEFTATSSTTSDGCRGIESVIANRPSRVVELKVEFDLDTLSQHIVMNETDICFIGYATSDIWLLSTTTWKCTKLCQQPIGYNLLCCAINGELVALRVGDANDVDHAVMYCVETQSWMRTRFPLTQTVEPASGHIACIS